MYDVTWGVCSSQHINKLWMGTCCPGCIICGMWAMARQQFYSCWSLSLFVGQCLVSSTGDSEWTESSDRVFHFRLTQIPQKVLCTFDSRTVAMKVGTCQGVCNNSPTEVRGPDNGLRWSLSVHSNLYRAVLLARMFVWHKWLLGEMCFPLPLEMPWPKCSICEKLMLNK